MADKLKQCPFCGGEAYIEEESDSFSTVQYVARCKSCLVEVRINADMTKSFEYNRQKVTETWNNRPTPWHTGTPTDEGWYLVTSGGNNSASYDIGKWDGESFRYMEYLDSEDVIAWWKIEPYKEKESDKGRVEDTDTTDH